jgi:hypothetical protein
MSPRYHCPQGPSHSHRRVVHGRWGWKGRQHPRPWSGGARPACCGIVTPACRHWHCRFWRVLRGHAPGAAPGRSLPGTQPPARCPSGGEWGGHPPRGPGRGPRGRARHGCLSGPWRGRTPCEDQQGCQSAGPRRAGLDLGQCRPPGTGEQVRGCSWGLGCGMGWRGWFQGSIPALCPPACAVQKVCQEGEHPHTGARQRGTHPASGGMPSPQGCPRSPTPAEMMHHKGKLGCGLEGGQGHGAATKGAPLTPAC